MFGYMGKILRVNLSKQKIIVEKLEEKTAKKYIGGRGLGAKILFNELKLSVDPLGPENKLVVATGVLTGIPFGGNSRYVVMAKSPLTGIWGEANASGFFGPELKRAGCDAIIIEGKANAPVYLWIHNGEAEIKDANHLWGKTTGETQEIIRNEVKDKNTRVACIGPGGEHLVKYACIMSDLNRAAGRTGMGAVMGSKRLKAIATRGTEKIEFAEEKKLMELARIANKEVWGGSYGDLLYKYGTDGDLDDLNATGRLPTKNFGKSTFENAERITGETMAETILVRRKACYACPIACIRVVKTKKPYVVDATYGGPEYETTAALGSLCMNDNLVAVAKANELCNKYSIDTISTGVAIAFAMECYEKGIITKKDTEGIDLTWGNHKAMIQLIEKIAYRKGFGDVLAEGVKRAAEKIGKGAEKFAMHIKGQEVPMHEPRGKKGLAISYATSNRGACHLQAEHDDIFEDEKWLCPEIGLDKTLTHRDRLYLGKDKAKLVKIAGDLWALYDSLIVCKFTAYPEGGIGIKRLAEIVANATGWDITINDLMTVGERAFNLCRAFNVREGITRKDDVLPERLMEPLPEGPYKGETISLNMLNRALDDYYEFRGWHKQTGIPSEKKLTELNLKYAAEELHRLGKLPA
jgi:aldehyde:ferredoxin oxidoreductase